MNAKWIVVLFAVFLLGCSPDSDSVTDQVDSAQIERVSKEFVQAMINSNFSKAFKLTSKNYRKGNSKSSMQKGFNDYFFSNGHVVIRQSEIGSSFIEEEDSNSPYIGYSTFLVPITYIDENGGKAMNTETIQLYLVLENGNIAVESWDYY